ncbi:MAG TPA: hypothetical protein VL177_01875, partial [Terriglobales bacterium]|nr:hypothetical protein [Terriglobales bacterium]
MFRDKNLDIGDRAISRRCGLAAAAAGNSHPRTLVGNIPYFAWCTLARLLVSRFTPGQFLWQRLPQANRAEVGFSREAGCEKQQDEQLRG